MVRVVKQSILSQRKHTTRMSKMEMKKSENNTESYKNMTEKIAI